MQAGRLKSSVDASRRDAGTCRTSHPDLSLFAARGGDGGPRPATLPRSRLASRSAGGVASAGVCSGARKSAPESPLQRAAREAVERAAGGPAGGITPLPAGTARRAGEFPLAEFYAAHMRPWRAKLLAAGDYGRSSWQTEQRHVRAWAAWDQAHPPEGWPGSMPWRGMPVGKLSAAWLKAFVEAEAKQGASAGTIRSRLQGLSVVLNHAKKLGVIRTVPRVRQPKRVIGRLVSGDDDQTALAYTDAQLGAIYAAVPEAVARGIESGVIRHRSRKRIGAFGAEIAAQLQAAIVLGANCGPRASDWFVLDFERHVKSARNPPELAFTAGKTQKLHRIPLADVTRRHLDRLRKRRGLFLAKSAWLFPDLSNPDLPTAKKRKDSRPQRRTVALMRLAMEAAGIDPDLYRTPLHSVRKSCTTRFNLWGVAHRKGPLGNLITHGKDADVASTSYFDTMPTLAEAVASIDWPAEFLAD